MHDNLMYMKQLPTTPDPLVVRTCFESQESWETVCALIRAPQYFTSDPFYANVYLLDDIEFENLATDALLARVPGNYPHSFLLVVDRITITSPEFPVLVIDLYADRGRSFRAIPPQIQGIENNLSIANMDFFEFADNVDPDGIFRGFPES
ncbi:MAG TPA: hypothetical protein VL127_17085 [Bryobacteraceae bacterium]|jgi:hypothetical protein|nr:hypothetical protein [Bryobacteraceae bacterium]